ncbi:MAG: amidohydrolase family protein [Prochlorococcaceae cyanobacterium]
MRLRIPRCLIDGQRGALPAPDDEGLVAVSLQIEGARVAAIAADPQASAPAPLALTPLVEPHAHLDKSFTYGTFANPGGTMEGALAANLREFEQRNAEQVHQRSERALEQAWRYGLRAIRSHIDSGGGPASEASWQVLLEQQRRWADRLTLQLVALVPIRFWLTPEGEALAQRVAAAGGLLGGVLGPPFGHRSGDALALRALLQLASRLGCGVDLHVDEGETQAGLGVELVVRTALELGAQVPITCSHASSMGLLSEARCNQLAEQMAAAGIQVVALPRTNLWLLGRRSGQTPWIRVQAPIRPLQQAGVEVSVGGDNVQDPWYPGGDYDPIELLRLCFTTSHLDPWQRQGLAPFTTSPARLMGLDWDGVLRPGCPADLLVLEVHSWQQVLARPPQRRVMRSGVWIDGVRNDAPAAMPS